MGESTLTLIAGGDVGPVAEPVDRLIDLALPIFVNADFRIVQCERSYSERGYYQEWSTIPPGKHSRLHPRLASIFNKAQVDVVSLASNHLMDWGYEPLLDTIDLFNRMGMKVIGAGRTEEEARRPAIIEKNGVRVAILGYCSVIRDGQVAEGNKPGIAPMRTVTSYERIDYQPGTPPRITTRPCEFDVKAMESDIVKARRLADSVVVFLHWGIRMIPKTLTGDQIPVAHAAIDAGADLIVGHHPHVPKAIEVYKGKVCFYSIGSFLTTGNLKRHKSAEWDLIWFEFDTDPKSLYSFPEHCKKTILPKIVFSKRGVERVSFLPAFINKLAQPEILAANDLRFQDLVNYMEWVSDIVPHKLKVDKDEVLVET